MNLNQYCLVVIASHDLSGKQAQYLAPKSASGFYNLGVLVPLVPMPLIGVSGKLGEHD